MEIKCKFKQQNDVVERGTFKSRKVWVITEDDTKYPQTIEVEVAQDKVDLFNTCRPGQPLTVSINLRGREWTNPQDEVKVFNTLQCWKVISDVPDQQEEEAPVTKVAPKRKAGNIEKKFENEYIQELTDDNNDFPF